MKKCVFISLFLTIGLVGIMSFVFAEDFCGVSTGMACSSNSDCKIGGCSGQICGGTNESTTTICEMKACYNADLYNMVCTCSENKCIWTPATNVTKCASASEMCGGIASIQCCSGLTCQLEGNYPDASGKCAVNSSKCAKEGEQFSKVYPEYPKQCCAGLTEWDSGMDTRKVVNNTCIQTDLVSGLPIGTCINCGNGICEQWESICNCPKDCQPTKCIESILSEGETSIVDGKSVYIEFISVENVKLNVNGEVTNSLVKGQTYKLRDSSYIGIKGILYNSKDSGISSVKFSISSTNSSLENGACCDPARGCKPAEVKEKVECVFSGSAQLQKCYTAEQNSRAYCSGTESCSTDILGYKGERIIWKSTCGGYAYTLVDGTAEYAKFDCSVVGTCVSGFKCDDGTVSECKIENGQCICSTCPTIIIKPVCGNGICESGEGEICSMTQVMCKIGQECKAPSSSCFVVCPKDCKALEPIDTNLGEKFKLQMYQTTKIKENGIDIMKINFKDLIAYKCDEVGTSSEASSVIENKVAATGMVVMPTEDSPATEILKCVGAGPKALLDVGIILSSQTGVSTTLNLNLGEKKQIGGFTILFASYDYASRTGTFLVTRETFLCPKNCKCDENGNTIICPEKVCKKGETLCPDGECREKCEIISEDCKFGCMYDGKCFPIGVRSNGTYCGGELFISQQKASDEVCENNFECTSNVCVSGKCINEGLLQKILSWFKNIFG